MKSTLPETKPASKAPQKMDGWKMMVSFLGWGPISRGQTCWLRFRECHGCMIGTWHGYVCVYVFGSNKWRDHPIFWDVIRLVWT